ncbi:MAG TPA: hypothetical protein PLC07_10465 [Bacillota bacterium]|nr:hypothetical protein [Bacillota bacterium]HPT87940.1 hypothetical protein [Bacillota bacterium]
MALRAKLRFDYKAENRSKRFFWRKRDLKEVAREIRDQKISLLRNLPFQGIQVAELNADQEVYLIPGDETTPETAYAPVELVVEADSLEDLMQLTLNEDFRKIKVLEPDKLQLSPNEMERFLFRVNEEYRNELADFN